MNPKRHKQVKRLFLAACELDPGSAAALLDQACAGDPELRREVESLPVPKLPGAGFDLGELLGLRYKLGTLIGVLLGAVTFGLIVLLLMLLLRVVVRLPWLATLAFCVVLTAALSAASRYDVFLPWATNAVVALAIVLILTRVGLIALIAGWAVRSLLLISPLDKDFGAWYAPAGIFALIVVTSLLAYGFHTALAGRPLLPHRLPNE